MKIRVIVQRGRKMFKGQLFNRTVSFLVGNLDDSLTAFKDTQNIFYPNSDEMIFHPA